ncbi:Uncharacterized protein PCOAH_00029220 [Plasmodium coatneyi]|uniref:MerC domain-containing protein n=1 Tax=Plasmodium coatneyi TaxID=208452 RepID=A0A1B1E180_9APIC|nr:Uncharacterized protein PCOAH_00029220 [Plasmodium coatneyi]ANQ08720.1 Uncharacterized protein PCOAH_00029220 [Plasmodium coatneyi]
MKDRVKRIYIYIKSNLNNISNIASIICLLDCALIPVITVLISIFDVVKGSQDGHANAGDHDHGHDHSHDHGNGWHEIVERVALYVMTPIISFTTIYNFVQLKNISLLLMTLVGITLFILSHAHIPVSNPNVMSFLKKVHMPMAILAAVILISTNYAAHKLLKAKNLDRCCKHKKIPNHCDEQSCKEHHSCQHHHHHHHHQHDIEMNGNNYDMQNSTGSSDKAANFEKYYNIGFQQNGDHELVRFL